MDGEIRLRKQLYIIQIEQNRVLCLYNLGNFLVCFGQQFVLFGIYYYYIYKFGSQFGGFQTISSF